MARPKKNGMYLNVCIDAGVYTKLEKICLDAGQTKTAAVERALTEYFAEYENKQRMLKELEAHNVR